MDTSVLKNLHEDRNTLVFSHIDSDNVENQTLWHKTPWRIEQLTSLHDIHRARTLWLDLERKNGNKFAPFQSYAWCESWVRQFCALPTSPYQPRIFLIYKNNNLLALLPMMKKRHFGLDILTVLGAPHTQMASVLYHHNVDCREGIRYCLDLLPQYTQADVINYGPFGADDILTTVLEPASLTPDPAEHYTLVTWPPQINSYDYLKKISKNRRKNFNSKTQKLQQKGTLTFQCYRSDHLQFAPMTRKAFALKQQWLKQKKIFSIALSRPGTEHFLANIKAHDSAFNAEMAVLSLDQRPIALSLYLNGTSMKHCYLSTFDPEFAAYSPGALLVQYSIHDSIDRGFEAYNFLGYPSAFKALWQNETQPCLRYQRALSFKGKIWLYTWVNGLRPALKQSIIQMRTGFKRNKQ